MSADLPDPGPNSFPNIVAQSLCRADLLDEHIQRLRELAVLIEQFMDHGANPRLFLQKRGHVPIPLLETEMVGEMRTHRGEAAAQFALPLRGSLANGLF
jgi:hypothetical protein